MTDYPTFSEDSLTSRCDALKESPRSDDFGRYVSLWLKSSCIVNYMHTPVRSYVISLNPGAPLFTMRRRIQKATSRLRKHLLGSGHRNPVKIPRKHILVVESDDNSVEMLRLYLGHFMYRVTAADTCGECLQLARTERVDLYLLGDGCEAGGAFELCRKIRALDSNTPIIFCSADASPADRQ
jgi:Response regulator receiver domain